jgi:hemerythrin-like domain-containing protein
MQAIEELKAEHQGVLRVLLIMEALVRLLEMGRVPERRHLEEVLEFLGVFVDRCHHGKEEDHLFPALERSGVPRQGGPIGVMLAEHEQGRGLVRSMGQALARLDAQRSEAGAELVLAARQYIGLLRQHIHKEEDVLFVMAEAKLSAEVLAGLAKAFEELERERIGPGRHEAFHAMIQRLSDTYLG